VRGSKLGEAQHEVVIGGWIIRVPAVPRRLSPHARIQKAAEREAAARLWQPLTLRTGAPTAAPAAPLPVDFCRRYGEEQKQSGQGRTAGAEFHRYWYWMYNGLGVNRSTSVGVMSGSPAFVSLRYNNLKPAYCTGSFTM
jgi:hypothetical protein